MKIYHYKNLGHDLYYEYICKLSNASHLNIGKIIYITDNLNAFTIGITYKFDALYSELVKGKALDKLNKIIVFQ